MSRPKRLVAISALLVATIGGTIVFVSQPQLRNECPPAGTLANSLDRSSPIIEALCAQSPDLFRQQLRGELASQIGGQLWRRGIEGSDTDAAVELWLQRRAITFPGGPPWQVPSDPDWTEDPYGNISWQAGYQSLAWLATLARGYREGNSDMGADLRHYLMSWIEANPLGHGQSVRSWSNGTVHRRTNTLVAIWDVLLKVLSDDELEQVLRSLQEHGEQLDSYLSDERFRGHNHNLFHALALVNLSRNVTLLANADQWRVNALRRMHTLLREMVDSKDGVSTEQSAAYHYLAMRLFLQAQRYLHLEGEGLGREDLELLAKMTRFGAFLPDSAGSLPAIGDTRYGMTADGAFSLLAQYAELGLIAPEADYILTGGKRGARPADLTVFSGEGYAVFRPLRESTEDPEDSLHVVVDMGPEPRVHGHDDAMNVLMSAFGYQLLVDSGGPYQYGVNERGLFTSAGAHNVVLLNGGGGDAAGAQITHTADSPTHSLISGEKPLSASVTHQRTVILVKPSLLLVVDQLTDGASEDNSYQLLYHLPPEAEISSRGTTAIATVGGAAVGVAVAAGASTEMEIVDGWVTRSQAAKETAPVLRFTQHARTAWFITALVPGTSAMQTRPSITAERDGNAFRVEIASGVTHWSVIVPDDGAPVTVRNELAGDDG